MSAAHSVSKQSAAVHGTQGHAPADVHHDHAEDDSPEAWGWHGETGKLGRIGAWFAVIVLLLFLLGNEPFPSPGHVAAIGFAVLLAVVLLWDRQRRKNAWRAR